MQGGDRELEMHFTNGSRGGAALCGDRGRAHVQRDSLGPVVRVSVKSPEVREEATRSASHGGKKMGVVSSHGAEVSSQRRACLRAFTCLSGSRLRVTFRRADLGTEIWTPFSAFGNLSFSRLSPRDGPAGREGEQLVLWGDAEGLIKMVTLRTDSVLVPLL